MMKPPEALLTVAISDIITMRNRGAATTTVTKVSASMPRVSIRVFSLMRRSLLNWSAFMRKKGFSWPPDAEVVTTPCRKSCHFGEGERLAASLRALRMSLPMSSMSRVIHWRSEEHTSELQSQFHLVCRLLLEKKKKNKI